MTQTAIREHSPLESVMLHLAPGAAIAALTFALGAIFAGSGIPTMVFLEAATLVLGTPLLLAVMRRYSRVEGLARTLDVVPWRATLRPIDYVVWPLVALAAAAFVMMTVGKLVTPSVQRALFGWLPARFDIADVYLRPEQYSRIWLIVVWIGGLLTTTIWFPVMEELSGLLTRTG